MSQVIFISGSIRIVVANCSSSTVKSYVSNYCRCFSSVECLKSTCKPCQSLDVIKVGLMLLFSSESGFFVWFHLPSRCFDEQHPLRYIRDYFSISHLTYLIISLTPSAEKLCPHWFFFANFICGSIGFVSGESLTWIFPSSIARFIILFFLIVQTKELGHQVWGFLKS